MKTHQKAEGKYRYSVMCPNCSSQSVIRSSKQMSSTSRECYCHCSNFTCGLLFVANVEVIRTINTPHPAAVMQKLPQQVEADFFDNQEGDLLGGGV